MAETLKIRKVGNSLGVLLPRETVEELDVKEGDELFVTHSPDVWGLRITPYDPDFAEAVEYARTFMRTHRNALRELVQ